MNLTDTWDMMPLKEKVAFQAKQGMCKIGLHEWSLAWKPNDPCTRPSFEWCRYCGAERILQEK